MKTDSRTQRELVERAQENLEAFGELVERYRNSIQRQCFSRVRDHQHAEDLAQDVFIRAYLKLDQLSEPEFFPNWLRKIASNVCNEFLRSPARREFATDLLPEQAACTLTPALSLAERGLPEETRACVELFYNSGLSYSEIADTLHTTVKSVKGRLSRARAVLRKELAEMEPCNRSPFTQRVLDTLEQLRRDDPKTRQQAASKLHSALAPDRIDTALGWLGNPDPLERSYAIRVSRKYHSPRVRDRLVEILLNDEWEENRLKPANALIAQRDPSVIPSLEQAMADPCNPRDVVGAAKSAIKQLHELRPPSDTEPERLGFRRELAQAADKPESRAELLCRLKSALDDPSPEVRSQALKALGELGDKRAAPAVAKLLDDPHEGLRSAAALALGRLGGVRAIAALAESFQASSGRRAPTTALLSLAQIGDRSVMPMMTEAFGGSHLTSPLECCGSGAWHDVRTWHEPEFPCGRRPIRCHRPPCGNFDWAPQCRLRLHRRSRRMASVRALRHASSARPTNSQQWTDYHSVRIV